MSNQIEIGSQVVCPVTDKDGEESHVVGELVNINSRMAHVKISDGTVLKVGKTKIEAIVGNTKKVKVKKTEYFCPECNKSSHDCHYYKNVIEDGFEDFKTNEYWCQECDVEFGPEIKRRKINHSNYNYQPCVAASGRKSLDNGDQIALKLRGKTLDEVYEIASDILEVGISELRAKYAHLNPGQQRMCLGNRLRKS